MCYYLQTVEEFGQTRSLGVWLVENIGARRIDVDGATLGSDPGVDMVALLRPTYPGSRFHRLTLD